MRVNLLKVIRVKLHNFYFIMKTFRVKPDLTEKHFTIDPRALRPEPTMTIVLSDVYSRSKVAGISPSPIYLSLSKTT